MHPAVLNVLVLSGILLFIILIVHILLSGVS